MKNMKNFQAVRKICKIFSKFFFEENAHGIKISLGKIPWWKFLRFKRKIRDANLRKNAIWYHVGSTKKMGAPNFSVFLMLVTGDCNCKQLLQCRGVTRQVGAVEEHQSTGDAVSCRYFSLVAPTCQRKMVIDDCRLECT